MMEGITNNGSEKIENTSQQEEVIIKDLQVTHPEIYNLISDIYRKDSGYSVSDSYELVTEEGVYNNTQRTRELASIAYAIKSKLPSVKNGYTRLWRGNRKKEVGKNPSYTTSLTGIALPFLMSYEGPLSFVDIPNNLLPSFSAGLAATEFEYRLPQSFLEGVHIVGFSEEEASALLAGSGESQEVVSGNNPWGSTWA